MNRNELIDERLDALRPDRYQPGEGADWLADLVADKGLLVVDDLEQELRGDAAVKREVAS